MKLNTKMDIIDYKKDKYSKDYWWFKGACNLLDILLKKVSKERKNLKILDVGCGVGEDVKIIKKYGKVTALDNSIEALKLIPDDLVERKILVDAQNLPGYLYNKFDIIIIFEVLEHVEKDELVMYECYKALKKGGILILAVPAISRMYSTHDRALKHYRRYDKKDLLRKINKRFKIEYIYYWNSILFLPIFAMRILKKKSKKSGTDIVNLPKVIDNFLYNILKFENYLIKKNIHLLVGVSLVVIAKKVK